MFGNEMTTGTKNISNRLSIEPLSGTFGARVQGIDLTALDAPGFDAVYRLMIEHQVVVFRDQRFAPEQYLDFARRWGEIHRHPFMQDLEDHPGILEIIKSESDTRAFGNGWHSDQMFTEKPSKFTMLYAREVPERGGDTLFANMYTAYDRLSDRMKTTLGDLKSCNTGDRGKLRSASANPANSLAPAKMHEQAPPADLQTEAKHPLIRTHADSLRKALYFGGHCIQIDGMTAAESAPLLKFLRTHTTQPEFTCRVDWEVDSLTIWDNRCVQHYAINDYDGQRRRMQRITIAGDEIPV
jgi:taurine dioxygenase